MIGVVVLAAGFSRRFGSDKRFHELEDGRPMLLATVQRHIEVFEHVQVVLRPGDDRAEALLSTVGNLVVTHATDAYLGMGHSLAAGIRAADQDGWRAAFVALADMPFVSARTLEALLGKMAAAADTAIIVPTCNGERGHPVGFARTYFEALSRLQGDAGARTVLESASGDIVSVDVDDTGVLRDLDTPP